MKNKILKRIPVLVSLVLAFTVAFSGSICSAAITMDEPDLTLYGDADGNGVINSDDALVALQYAVGKNSLEAATLAAADVTGTNKVDSADALSILQYTVGNIIVFPCKEAVNLKARELLDLKQTVKFNSDGNFRILQLSDPQEKGIVPPITQNIVDKLVIATEPDLVIFTGDNIYDDSVYRQQYGKAMDEAAFITYFRTLVDPIEKRQIPWCSVFGNHDSEFLPFDRAEQMRIFEENFDYYVGSAGDESIHGVGNYVIPVIRSDGRGIGFNIWGIDSGTYMSETGYEAAAEGAVLGSNIYNSRSYDYIHLDQQLWYWNTSVLLEEFNGSPIAGAMFAHIPLNEFSLILKNPEETGMVGLQHEEVASSPVNSGMFATILKRGDVKGFYAGHDHVNTFSGTVDGIELGFCGGISYYDYGGYDGYDPDPSTCGGRVIDINENSAFDYTSHTVLYRDVI